MIADVGLFAGLKKTHKASKQQGETSHWIVGVISSKKPVTTTVVDKVPPSPKKKKKAPKEDQRRPSKKRKIVTSLTWDHAFTQSKPDFDLDFNLLMCRSSHYNLLIGSLKTFLEQEGISEAGKDLLDEISYTNQWSLACEHFARGLHITRHMLDVPSKEMERLSEEIMEQTNLASAKDVEFQKEKELHQKASKRITRLEAALAESEAAKNEVVGHLNEIKNDLEMLAAEREKTLVMLEKIQEEVVQGKEDAAIEHVNLVITEHREGFTYVVRLAKYHAPDINIDIFDMKMDVYKGQLMPMVDVPDDEYEEVEDDNQDGRAASEATPENTLVAQDDSPPDIV
ncbi:hypothetical protein Fmac_018114 [Flemingia macrophylla]|uniref:Uncharacterized protein n=1 Tax=Flemingia macrophylla TaxID=520843 RepID=A0ABD1M414_9FABA